MRFPQFVTGRQWFGFRNISGFSLIELCVVLVIIGLLTSFAVMKLTVLSRQQLIVAVSLLARSIKSAELEAILMPAVLEVIVTPEGYHFYRYMNTAQLKKKQWLPLISDHLSRNHAFSKHWQVHVRIRHANQKTKRQDKSIDMKSIRMPPILILPSGEVTPVDIQLQTESKKETMRLHINSGGKITCEPSACR